MPRPESILLHSASGDGYNDLPLLSAIRWGPCPRLAPTQTVRDFSSGGERLLRRSLCGKLGRRNRRGSAIDYARLRRRRSSFFNLAAAARWYQQAADGNIADACNNLAILYDNGTGVPQDHTRAVALFKKGAGLGSVEAMASLAFHQHAGLGTPVDLPRALRGYTQAASAGHAIAMHNLARMYEIGEGTPRDLAAARRWYEKAAAAGNADARQWLKSHPAAR